MRSGGSVSFWLCALPSRFAAKSYNIVGRREFCCRAIILLGEGNSVGEVERWRVVVFMVALRTER
jgi:hypothetical protein